MFRVFGCRVFVNVLRKDRKNLQPHTTPCIFIGFSEGYKGWKIYNPATKQVSTARDVIFDELSFPGLTTKDQPDHPPPVTHRDLWPGFDSPDDDDEPPQSGPGKSDDDDDYRHDHRDSDLDSDSDSDDDDDTPAQPPVPATPSQ
jgi:hypothetical protein